MFINRIQKSNLSPKQKEALNFQRVSGILAEYGYLTIRVADNCIGFDFFAISINGECTIKIQLKSRLIFDKKNMGKEFYICFFDDTNCYVYPHDILLTEFIEEIKDTQSWSENGLYHFPYLTDKNQNRLKKFRLI